MNPIRIVFTCIGGLVMIGILAVGLGGAYLTHNPDEAAAYAAGTMSVDPDAGVVDRTRQMAGGYSRARAAIEEMEDDEASFSAAAPDGWDDSAASEADGAPADVSADEWDGNADESDGPAVEEATEEAAGLEVSE